MMKFKAFLWAILLSLCAAKGDDLRITHEFLESSSSTQIKERFLGTLKTPHKNLHNYIPPLMSSLDQKDMKDVFEDLVVYFEEKGNKGDVFLEEIMALQPWSILGCSIWENNRVFKECYGCFLKTGKYILDECKKKKDFQEKIVFLISTPLPMPEKIFHRVPHYEDQYKLLLLLANLKNSPPSRDPLLTPALIFRLACASKNMPVSLFMMGTFKKNPRIIKQFLQRAVNEGYTKGVLALLKRHPFLLKEMDEMGVRFFHSIIILEEKQKTIDLMERYPEFLFRADDDGATAMHYVCSKGETDMAIALTYIAASAGENNWTLFLDNAGATPVHHACRAGHTQTALKLLAQYPDFIFMPDKHGSTLLHYACKEGHTQTALELTKKYPKLLPMTNRFGLTALDIANSSCKSR